MKNGVSSVQSNKLGGTNLDLVSLLSRHVIGQQGATKAIVPYVYMYQSGLAPEGRPAGVFLLLGPTGTGKTKTVEAIAQLLHGSEKKVLKIDCGEFQLEHEMAKLIGAPPGYLGHRETTPMITQQALTEVVSQDCDLALVLFDEIEKGAQSLTKLLLGILDKGILRLGDNTTVNFEKSLIFFTSNLGARQMLKELTPDIGFHVTANRDRNEIAGKLEGIALGAVRKRFSPEFVNRIDAIVTYQPLNTTAIESILEHDIRMLQTHVNSRLGDRCFSIEVSPESRQLLLRKGVSEEYGARELKRTIHRELTQPLATMVARGEIGSGGRVNVSVNGEGDHLAIEVLDAKVPLNTQQPAILIVDDNRDLLLFLAAELEEEGWRMLTAQSAEQARVVFMEEKPNTVLLDYMLGADDGLRLGMQFQNQASGTQIIIMTGGGLSADELAICEEREFPILYKPFLSDAILNLVRGQYRRATAAASI
jgi:ATP-dependent Clp protease ATP-binding subunit ClpA/CheY-like chemotaxis protein